MAINSISSGPALSDIQSVTQTTASASIGAPSNTTDAASSTASGGVSVEISKLGQLRSALGDLAQNNPAQFKAVTADIAQKLKDAARDQTGSRADALNKIADRFDSASQSGNAADLSPPSGGVRGHHHHGGRHHGHGGGGGGDAASGDSGDSGGPGSQADLVQGIISGALSAATTTTTKTSTTSSSS